MCRSHSFLVTADPIQDARLHVYSRRSAVNRSRVKLAGCLIDCYGVMSGLVVCDNVYVLEMKLGAVHLGRLVVAPLAWLPYRETLSSWVRVARAFRYSVPTAGVLVAG